MFVAPISTGLQGKNEFLSRNDVIELNELASSIADYYFPHGQIDPIIIAEKNDIVEFQKKNWADAKDQFARNKMQIANFFSKFKTEKSN